MNILHLDAGLFNGQSVTRHLTAKLVEKLKNKHTNAEVIYRDLAVSAPAHLDSTILMAAGKEPSEQSSFEKDQLALTATLLDELLAADIIVVAAPMYNFTIPSQLKAWLDRVLQSGKTFRYTENGSEGLVKDKTVYIASSRGGIYSEGAAAAMEHQESYLTTALNFIGITDIHIVRAEGVNMGDEPKAKAIAGAEERIEELAV